MEIISNSIQICAFDSTSSWHAPLAGFYEQSDEHFGFIKGGEYLDHLSNYYILENSFTQFVNNVPV